MMAVLIPVSFSRTLATSSMLRCSCKEVLVLILARASVASSFNLRFSSSIFVVSVFVLSISVCVSLICLLSKVTVEFLVDSSIFLSVIFDWISLIADNFSLRPVRIVSSSPILPLLSSIFSLRSWIIFCLYSSAIVWSHDGHTSCSLKKSV